MTVSQVKTIPEDRLNDIADFLSEQRHLGKISQAQHGLLLQVYELLCQAYGDLQIERIKGVLQLAQSEGINKLVRQTKLIQEKNPLNFLPRTQWSNMILLEAELVSSVDHEEALNCYFLIIRAYVDQVFLCCQ